VLTWLRHLLAKSGGVPMSFPPDAGHLRRRLPDHHRHALRGFLSLGILKNSQPADLLR
jgi:putative ABC transport system permease protein